MNHSKNNVLILSFLTMFLCFVFSFRSIHPCINLFDPSNPNVKEKHLFEKDDFLVIDTFSRPHDQRVSNIVDRSYEYGLKISELFGGFYSKLTLMFLDPFVWDLKFALKIPFGLLHYQPNNKTISVPFGFYKDFYYDVILKIVKDRLSAEKLFKLGLAFNLAKKESLSEFINSIPEHLAEAHYISRNIIAHEIGHHFINMSGLKDKISETVNEILASLIKESVRGDYEKEKYTGIDVLMRFAKEEYEEEYEFDRQAVIQDPYRLSLIDGEMNRWLREYAWYTSVHENEIAKVYSQKPGFTKKLIQRLVNEREAISNKRFVEIFVEVSGENFENIVNQDVNITLCSLHNEN
ncbi:MAG: hypothetical protein ABIA04_09560 [Pseudomonadota bacterium]